jgi:hypothetical protein
MKRPVLAILLAGFIGLIVWFVFLSKRSETPVEMPGVVSERALPSSRGGLVEAPPTPGKSAVRATPRSEANRIAGTERRETRPVSEWAPTREEYVADVDRDPHRPPNSLNAFARALAGRFDEAVASPEKADAFFSELRDCVESTSSRTVLAARGLCLYSAKQLGEKVPALRERTHEFWERADPTLKRLAR